MPRIEGGRTTVTGLCAAATTEPATDPSMVCAATLCPTLPTTTSDAAAERSISAVAGSPRRVSSVISGAGVCVVCLHRSMTA